MAGLPVRMQLQHSLQGWVGMKGLPSAASMLQTSRRIMRGRDASKIEWWRQRWARIEAVEAVEAIEKLFLSALRDARSKK